jgi:hypothetical protein
LQILDKPRFRTEKEDVHLIRTFLISTKPNKALWRINRDTGHDIVQGFLGKDFYAHPDRIFKPIDEGYGGHVKGGYENELKQMSEHSLGKITRLYGPYYYQDNPRDYWYDAEVKLNSSKTASTLLDLGSKTWTPFAVSPHVWPKEGDDDNMTDWQPMGLALVIEPAYGKEAVISKYCAGSALSCGTSLTAAIQNPTKEMLPEIINSLVSKVASGNIMSTQEVTGTSASQVPNIAQNSTSSNAPVQYQQPQTVVELKKDEQITLTKEEYDTVQKQLKEQTDLKNEVASLKQERNTNILKEVFGSIEDQEARENVIKKYVDKDVNLVNQAINDYKSFVVPKLIANGQTVKEGKPESKTASLKPEPKISKEESKVASITEPTASEIRSILGL